MEMLINFFFFKQVWKSADLSLQQKYQKYNEVPWSQKGWEPPV